MYDFEVEKAVSFARENGIKRLLMQFADGLKPFSTSVAREVEEALGGVEVIVSGDSCYGACDVAFDSALSLGAQGLVHFGHTPFPEVSPYSERVGVKACFIEAFSRISSQRALEGALNILSSMEGVGKVGLTASLQHVWEIPSAMRELERAGYRVFVGEGSARTRYPGQVLGCDYTSAMAIRDKVDLFIHIGGGLFHALGLQLSSRKPVIACDPYRGEAKDISREAFKVRSARLYTTSQVMDEVRLYGIVIGCKWRQRHHRTALTVKKLLNGKGRKTALVALREVTPESLDNITEPEAFIITACPRIPVDDYERYRRPILTVLEALIVGGVLRLEEWSLCDWFFNEEAASHVAFKDG
ncbi:MAG: diphthamide biosynthesis enzyme Dph2 [Candidatus Nezhaarchaeota archaeon]|nr:diphthamide biosynthesis enzyme Dph2 [Candidatus Nezhaarchaeota archaeon]